MGVKRIRTDSVRELRMKSIGVTPPRDWSDVEQVREAVRQETGAACSAAIYAGIEVNGRRYRLPRSCRTRREGAGTRCAR